MNKTLALCLAICAVGAGSREGVHHRRAREALRSPCMVASTPTSLWVVAAEHPGKSGSLCEVPRWKLLSTNREAEGFGFYDCAVMNF